MEEGAAGWVLRATTANVLETVPFAPLPSAQHAHGITTNTGDVNMAGRDVIVHKHTHMYAAHNISIVAALRMVRNLRSIHLDVLSKATPGTGVWLLQTDKFLLWLDFDGNIKILWGTGIPGAGKTVLASLVINDLESRAVAAGGSICICYIYFRYSDSSDLSVRCVLEILVKQTVERHPECLSLAEDTYARHLREDTQPTEAELLQLFQGFAGAKSATFYILDALDEAPPKLQLELVQKLVSLNVRLFVTSRPLKGVESRISGVYSFPIVARLQDIELHIDQKIQRSPGLQDLLERAGPSLREEIVSSIKKNCDGMFLHAALQLNALCDCLSPCEVRRTLEAFPSNIDGVYLQTWDRILQGSPTRVSLAKNVLVWVLNAARSMMIEELERAVAISPETYEVVPDEVVPGMALVTLCRGLLAFEEESRVVHLVHYTAKATLQGLIHDSYPHPHSHLATVCMNHLTHCGFQNTSIRSEGEFIAARQADPLLAYASDAWAIHARSSLDLEDSRMRAAKFVSEIHAFPAIINPHVHGSFDILRPLHILAVCNLPTSLIAQDDTGNPNVPTYIYQDSPLTLASWLGHRDIVEFLIGYTQIQVNLVESYGRSALMLAAGGGHQGVIKVLLAHPDINIDLPSNKGWSALMLAARYGYGGVVASLLSHPKVQINLVNNEEWSPLMLAAHHGHEGTVKILLARPEIQFNLISNKGRSALMLASCKGHEGTVKLLLAHADTLGNCVDNKGWLALMLAAVNGHEGTTRALLACPEIQVNLVSNEGSSALVVVASNGQGILELLLARGEIKVNLVNSKGTSALMKAAEHGDQANVDLLLAHPKIQVNLVDNRGRSALLIAARNGYEDIVKAFLVRPEIQVNLVDNHGWSALMLAAGNGHTGVVALLLAMDGINVNSATRSGLTALSQAVARGDEATIRLLLDMTDIDGTTNLKKAISIASAKKHTGIVRLLEEFEARQRGGDTEQSGWKGVLMNPIHTLGSSVWRLWTGKGAIDE